jgi:hypothetical protein
MMSYIFRQWPVCPLQHIAFLTFISPPEREIGLFRLIAKISKLTVGSWELETSCDRHGGMGDMPHPTPTPVPSSKGLAGPREEEF